MIHLDPSFLIRASVQGSPEGRKVVDWIRKNVEIAMSAVAWTEFRCGPVSVDEAALAARVVAEPLPFTAQDGTLAAAFFNATGRRRGSITDCMIAAAAVGAGATLATGNPADFKGFSGLEVLSA